MFKRPLLVPCLILMGFFAGVSVGPATRPSVQAQAPNVVHATAPKDWGPVRGGTLTLLIFEDSAGTLRLVDFSSGLPLLRFEIRRN